LFSFPHRLRDGAFNSDFATFLSFFVANHETPEFIWNDPCRKYLAWYLRSNITALSSQVEPLNDDLSMENEALMQEVFVDGIYLRPYLRCILEKKKKGKKGLQSNFFLFLSFST
jgi:hypothetical protein